MGDTAAYPRLFAPLEQLAMLVFAVAAAVQGDSEE